MEQNRVESNRDELNCIELILQANVHIVRTFVRVLDIRVAKECSYTLESYYSGGRMSVRSLISNTPLQYLSNKR